VPAKRCRVCVTLYGAAQYYQRDREEKRNGKWTAVPFFVVDPKQSAAMSEAVARAFVAKLQGLGVKNLWIEDCRDGRRMEVAREAQPQFVEDTRVISRATLDDEHSPDARWYIVKRVNRQRWPDVAAEVRKFIGVLE
jgi:hypothetical protein